jgi:multimeric flavodoxin WrbA
MTKIIILGSSRSNGNTRKAIDTVIGNAAIPVVDLLPLNINGYDYEHSNQDDDFIPLMERILKFETIILATPVYWYTMSWLMKIFLDRITDLLKIRKDLGRQLRGKKLFVVASFNDSLPKGFEDTFSQICEYLGMDYLGTSFIYGGDTNKEFLEYNNSEIERVKKTASYIM